MQPSTSQQSPQVVQNQQIQQQMQIIQKKVEPTVGNNTQMVQVGQKFVNVIVSESQTTQSKPPQMMPALNSQIPITVQAMGTQQATEATLSSSGPIITSNVIIQPRKEETLVPEVEAPKVVDETPPPQIGMAKQQITLQLPQSAGQAASQVPQTIKIIPSMDPSKIVEEDVEVTWQFLCDWRGCPKWVCNKIMLEELVIKCFNDF